MFVKHCDNCPRQCMVPRASGMGFCHVGEATEVASVGVHKGEEPALSGERGVCNVFFAHCNLRCCYCQNHEISRASVDGNMVRHTSIDEIVEHIAQVLPSTENVVGLVSPTQYADRIPTLVKAIRARGIDATIVYNTNGYERRETIERIADYIDVWLPDFKYIDAALAQRYSQAADYPMRAQEALRTIYSKVGAGLPTDERGIAFRGMIVRHLVLPGQIDNSIGCLRWLADNLGTRVHVSLMAQYFPPAGLAPLPDQLNRTLREEEYHRVVEEFETLGFDHGWVQELDSQAVLRPDFSKQQPFDTGNI